MKTNEQWDLKVREKRMKWVKAILAVLVIGFIWSTWVGFMYTPEINGKVVDVETGKPIKAKLQVTWRYVDLIGSHKMKSITLQCDEKGRFVIPCFIGLGHFLKRFDSQEIYVYAHSYGYGRLFFSNHDRTWITYPEMSNERLSTTNMLVKLNKLKTAEDWYKNIEVLNYHIAYYDSKFVNEEKRIFINKFPNAPEVEKLRWLLTPMP